jgi:hypothetical protein
VAVRLRPHRQWHSGPDVKQRAHGASRSRKGTPAYSTSSHRRGVNFRPRAGTGTVLPLAVRTEISQASMLLDNTHVKRSTCALLCVSGPLAVMWEGAGAGACKRELASESGGRLGLARPGQASPRIPHKPCRWLSVHGHSPERCTARRTEPLAVLRSGASCRERTSALSRQPSRCARIATLLGSSTLPEIRLYRYTIQSDDPGDLNKGAKS